MSFGGAFRSTIRSLSATRMLPITARFADIAPFCSPLEQPQYYLSNFTIRGVLGLSWCRLYSTSFVGAPFPSLIDARFPKRRPGIKSRRKRASLRPKGPCAWIQYVPGEPIPRSRPNEGSVQGRLRIKRLLQKRAFIVAEKRKKQAEWKVAKAKKRAERIDRKMAAVARQKAWDERLVELQQIEARKKTAMAS